MCYGSLHLTCYVDETLHCNIYMDGTMCMDGTCLCMNNVYGWNWCDMWYETYVLDMWYETYIFSVQIVGFNKKQKKQTICRLFAVCHRRQRALCRLPRTAKSLPSATVGKLTKWVSSQEAQLAATWLLCRLRQTAKRSLASVAGGKEAAYCLFFLFF